MPNKLESVSVIYYDKKQRPKFFNLPKSTIKTLIYLLPTVTLASIAIVIGGILYFKQIREIAKRSESQEIVNLREKNKELISMQQEINEMNKELQLRLSSKNVADKSSLEGLTYFKAVPGQKDLSSTPPLSIQETSFEEKNNQLNIRFKIQNETKDAKKLVGYVFIIQQAKNKFYFYPQDSFQDDQLVTTYTQGELFAVTRFRVTKANFPLVKGQNLFRVIIFSPTGDVLLKNVIKHTL